MQYSSTAEWLEVTGTGAFASGRAWGPRSRRYHALLMHAESPSSGRRVLVAGVDVWLESAHERVWLTQQRYQGGAPTRLPDVRCGNFAYRPWPRWTLEAPDGARIKHEVCCAAATGETVVRWNVRSAPGTMQLCVRPFLACRDYHALQHRDERFDWTPEVDGSAVTWRPYPGQPGIGAFTNGRYTHAPYWYDRFEYEDERRRGFDCVEDLASPGVFSWVVADVPDHAVMVLRALPGGGVPDEWAYAEPGGYAARLIATEEARRTATTAEAFAASQYLVRRGGGTSIIAGYPWFTDWGRDTCIALRGLCLSTGLLAEAQDVLETWGATVQDGLLPNRFPDDGVAPDYHAADAALWYVIAGYEYLGRARKAGRRCGGFATRFRSVAHEILRRYLTGAPFGIHATEDGLLAVGEPGLALTWMDARVAGRPVTGRVGKPVELQCLWINALEYVRRQSPDFNAVVRAARGAVVERFWCPDRGYLADVVDADHIAGRDDVALRPNQIFAVGGLPRAVVPKRIGARVLAAVEDALWTPIGLRTLDPTHPAYRAQYAGGPAERDAAYHQGTAWPWLLGAFAEAWLRVHGDTPDTRRTVRERVLGPLETHVNQAGLGHISEMADGDAPHTPHGCPFQAWSMGEYLRLKELCAESPARGAAE